MKPKTIACELPLLDADQTRQRIPVFPAPGDYVHPKGPFSLTEEANAEFAADINARGDSIVIDRDHAFLKGLPAPAAGWFVKGSAEVGADGGVSAEVEWTPTAAEQVRNREYRFISPEFSFTHQTADGKVLPEPKLHATTITNRPFFTMMDPIAAEDLPLEDALLVAEAYGEEIADSLTAISADAAQAIIAAAATRGSRTLFADPGYRKDGKQRYPLTSADDVVTAWKTIGRKNVAATYAADQLSRMKARIKRAAKKFGATIGADSTAGGDMDLTALAESFGLAADASEEDVLEAAGKVAAENADLKAKLDKAPKSDDIQTMVAEAVAEATKELRTERRDTVITGAITDLKITAAEKDTYEGFWKIDPAGTEKLLDGMSARLPSRPFGSESAMVPVMAADGSPLARRDGDGNVSADLTPQMVDGVPLPVDEDRAKIHAAATDLLAKQGVIEGSEGYESKYIAACVTAADSIAVEL